jgi:hypothetical protein
VSKTSKRWRSLYINTYSHFRHSEKKEVHLELVGSKKKYTHTHSPRIGWLQKKQEKRRDYSKWAFLFSFIFFEKKLTKNIPENRKGSGANQCVLDFPEIVPFSENRTGFMIPENASFPENRIYSTIPENSENGNPIYGRPKRGGKIQLPEGLQECDRPDRPLTVFGQTDPIFPRPA